MGAVDQNATFHHARMNRLRQRLRIEFYSDHEPHASHLDDRWILLLQLLKTTAEVVPCRNNVIEQLRMLDLVDHGDGDSAGQRIAAECRSVHSRCEGAGGLLGAEHGPDGNATSHRLRERCDVWLDT